MSLDFREQLLLGNNLNNLGTSVVQIKLISSYI